MPVGGSKGDRPHQVTFLQELKAEGIQPSTNSWKNIYTYTRLSGTPQRTRMQDMWHLKQCSQLIKLLNHCARLSSWAADSAKQPAAGKTVAAAPIRPQQSFRALRAHLFRTNAFERFLREVGDGLCGSVRIVVRWSALREMASKSKRQFW